MKEKVKDEERNATSRRDCAAPSQMITVKHDDGNDTNDNGVLDRGEMAGVVEALLSPGNRPLLMAAWALEVCL